MITRQFEEGQPATPNTQANTERSRQTNTPPRAEQHPQPPENQFAHLQEGVAQIRHMVDQRTANAAQEYFKTHVRNTAVQTPLPRHDGESARHHSIRVAQAAEYAREQQEDKPSIQVQVDEEAHEQLNLLDRYSRPQERERIERDRAQIAAQADQARANVTFAIEYHRQSTTIDDLRALDVEMQENLRRYDEENIPAELRNQAPLIHEGRDTEVARAYAQLAPEIENLRAEMDRIRSIRVEPEATPNAAPTPEPTTTEPVAAPTNAAAPPAANSAPPVSPPAGENPLRFMSEDERRRYVLEWDRTQRGILDTISLSINAVRSDHGLTNIVRQFVRVVQKASPNNSPLIDIPTLERELERRAQVTPQNANPAANPGSAESQTAPSQNAEEKFNKGMAFLGNIRRDTNGRILINMATESGRAGALQRAADDVIENANAMDGKIRHDALDHFVQNAQETRLQLQQMTLNPDGRRELSYADFVARGLRMGALGNSPNEVLQRIDAMGEGDERDEIHRYLEDLVAAKISNLQETDHVHQMRYLASQILRVWDRNISARQTTA